MRNPTIELPEPKRVTGAVSSSPVPQSISESRQGLEPPAQCASCRLDSQEESFDMDALHLVRQKEAMIDQSPSTQSYAALLKSIKERILTAQVPIVVKTSGADPH